MAFIKSKNSVFLFLILFSFFNHFCTGPNKEESVKSIFPNYSATVSENIKTLPENKKKERDSIISLLSNDPTYVKLTAEKNVSIDNLPLLQGIGQLMATYDGKTLGVNPEIQDLIEEKGHLNMMKNAIYLITRGGLTEDFLQVYDRHQKVFNYYGIKGNVLYTGNSEEIKIPFDYNLSIAFGVFDKENPKVLDAIYEASQRQLFEWSDEYNSNVIYPYLNYKSEYFKHLKKYYPKSKFYKEFDFELTAEQLYRAYEENEVAADQKYKGKKIAVSGRIAGIQKDIIGDTYVLLETNYYVNRIQCYFNDETVISNLRKGQDFTLIGTNYGMTLTNVILKDCQAY